MKQQVYADADFFIALLKDDDWLKKNAQKAYNKHKGSISVSPMTTTEIMLVCRRENIPLKPVLLQMSRIAKMESASWETFLRPQIM